MPVWLSTLLSVLAAALASTGFWQLLQKKLEKKDAKTRMILGLGHDRILALCELYIARGWIRRSEYENLSKYLFKPYIDLGGNGVVQHMMAQVDKLPIREEKQQ